MGRDVVLVAVSLSHDYRTSIPKLITPAAVFYFTH
jgi:hypothetical protein